MAEDFPKIIILTGPEEGQAFPLPTNGQMSLGRSDENDFILTDSSVSRQHALLIAREGRFFLKDHGSRNGTILEGTKLEAEEEVSLNHLDEFQIGVYEIRLILKPYTEAELKSKRSQTQNQPPKPVPPKQPDSKDPKEDQKQNKPEEIPQTEQKENPPQEDQDNIEAESLIDELMEEKEKAEEKITKKSRKKAVKLLFGLFLLLIIVAVAGFYFKDRFLNQKQITSTKQKQDQKQDQTVQKKAKKTKKSISSKNAKPKEKTPDAKTSEPKVQVLSVPENQKARSPQFRVFLDVKTEPLPATIYFEDKRLGLSPLKENILVEADQVHTLYADYELRDINDIYRKKVLFKAKPNTDVVELNIDADIGILKIQKLPRRVEFYLEGYYEYDKLHSNPVKITDITYGKPIYLPYGKYIVELREQTSVAGSENLITQIRYQREFIINQDNSEIDLSILDRDLKYFPAVIKSNPTNADVYQDGELLGKTPYEGKLLIGQTELIVKKDGYFPKELEINMNMNSVYETTVQLETSKVGELLNKAKELFHKDQTDQAMNTLIDALKYGGTEKEKSEVYYLLGNAYLAKKLYTEALPYFEKAKSYESFSLKATLGVAKAFQGLNNHDKALTSVIEVLANLDDDSASGVRSEAHDVFKKVSPFKSVIYVYTEPRGANVYLNDKKLSQQTPLILSELGLGNYRIEIEKPGYETYKTKQSLKLNDFVLVKVKLKKVQL